MIKTDIKVSLQLVKKSTPITHPDLPSKNLGKEGDLIKIKSNFEVGTRVAHTYTGICVYLFPPFTVFNYPVALDIFTPCIYVELY